MEKSNYIFVFFLIWAFVACKPIEAPEQPEENSSSLLCLSDLEAYLPYVVGQTLLFTPVANAGHERDTLPLKVSSVLGDSVGYTIRRQVSLVCDCMEMDIELACRVNVGLGYASLTINNPSKESGDGSKLTFNKIINTDCYGNLPIIIRVTQEDDVSLTCTLERNVGLTMFDDGSVLGRNRLWY